MRVVGLCLPFVALLPLLISGRLLAPCDVPLSATLPGAPQVTDPDPHGILNDAVFQLLPWEAEVRRSLRRGQLPLWSDLLDGGSSPWVNPQAAVLSPIALLGRLLPLERFLEGTLAVKIVLAFDGCWLLCLVLGARRFAAALAASAFALGGPITAWAVFPLSSVVAWSPWVALGVVQVVRRPLLRRIAVTALASAALWLSGHPESAIAATGVALGFGLVAVRRRDAVSASTAVGLALLLGVGLAAVQLVPFALVAPHSLRAMRVHALAAQASELGWFTGDSPRLAQAVLSPYAFGRPFAETFTWPTRWWPIAGGGYVGLVALAGAVAAFTRRRRRLVLALGALTLTAFLVTVGFFPFRWLLEKLPLGRALNVAEFLPFAALPFMVLAALGIGHLERRPGSPGWSAAVLAAAASLFVRHDPPLVCLWLLILIAVALAGLGRRSRPWGFGLLALATLIDLARWDHDVLPRGHRELFYPRTPVIAAISNGVAEQGGPWRAVAGGFGIYPSLLPMYGVADVRFNNPLALVDQAQVLSEVFEFRPESRRYKSAFRHLDHPLLDFLNVRVVALPEAKLVQRPLEALRAEPPLRVFRNPAALPRWFFPVGVELRAGRAAVIAALRNLRDPRRVVLDRNAARGWQDPGPPRGSDLVRTVLARPGSIRLELQASARRLLATSLAFPSGWKASSAGARLPTITVNGAFLGILVPAGASRLTLSFAPPGLVFGALISTCSAIVVALLALGSPLARCLHARAARITLSICSNI